MDKAKNKYVFDDSIDIGKKPLPIGNPEAKKAHDELIKKYKQK